MNTEAIQVAIRIRPNKELQNTDFLIKMEDSTKLNVSQPSENVYQQFSYDRVFPQNSSQQDVYSFVKNSISWVCDGYNSTIFTYGATNSGKTYTMFGENNNKGIVPRACEDLMDMIEKKDTVVEATMKCSLIEIYKEKTRDLLNQNHVADHIPSLRIRHDSKNNIVVIGLIEKFVYSYPEIEALISEGMSRRVVHSTALNDVSSRSHVILSLIIKQKLADGTELFSKLNLVDLAGSENVAKSEVQGLTLQEAQNINKSLSSLGNVIYALTEKNREHIPYRDSKLTYILKDSLGGNAKTILIANINPIQSCYSETLNTLKFAKRAKEIRNKPKINKAESIETLLATIEKLQKRIEELEGTCNDNKVIMEAVQSSEVDSRELTLYKTRCERLEKKIASLEFLLKSSDEKLFETKTFFEKQRELSRNIAKELYKERIRNSKLTSEIEQYELLYETLKDAVNENMDAIPSILENTNISGKVDEIYINDDEIEIYSTTE